MKTVKTIIFSLVVCSLMISCGKSKDKFRISIEGAESLLYKDSMRLPSRLVADSVINLYLEYAKQFPEDTMAADYLFRAGDLSYSVKEFPHAISFFGMIQDRFPKYRKAPLALFLQGFISENGIGDNNAAKNYYEKFLKQYPDSKLIPTVKSTLENLGKSPDELIKSFEQNASNKDSITASK